ncbi:MAG: beta-glucanase precursor [Gammaproteobacteria bacterium]
MKRIGLLLTLALFASGCTTTTVTEQDIRAVAQSLDYGDSTSATLVNKAWTAAKGKDYPELFAYTNRCVELYGDEGRKMNAALTGFEPEPTAAKLWALNDVGTCLYIMAKAYVELEKYPQAVAAYDRLANDFNYAQCWDPKGWFWRPSDGAKLNADRYRNW